MSTAAQRRWLFSSFFRREFSSRYSGTIAGGLWALGQPVLMLAIYSFVFRLVLKVGFPELGEHSFTAFIACALWPWMAFQEALQRGTQAIVSNAGLIKKVVFPHEILVFASIASTFAIHFVGFGVVWFVLVAFGEPFHAGGLLVVALAWLALFLLASGLTLLTAALQVFLKDIDHLLGPILMVVFYGTPILYPMSQVPESLQGLFALNPLVYVLEPIRSALLQGTYAGLTGIAILLAGAIGIFWAARAVFVRLSSSFEDFL
jgi:lipopolysaccharide transport system permease protein